MSTFEAEITVRRMRYLSEASGWAVVEAVAPDGKPLVLVGPLGHLEERERAHVLGAWQTDARYGPQVKVAEARPLPPADADSLRALLVRVRHVGYKRAQRLIDRLGVSGMLDAIDRDPPAAFAAAGLGARQAREAASSWDALRASRELH